MFFYGTQCIGLVLQYGLDLVLSLVVLASALVGLEVLASFNITAGLAGVPRACTRPTNRQSSVEMLTRRPVHILLA